MSQRSAARVGLVLLLLVAARSVSGNAAARADADAHGAGATLPDSVASSDLIQPADLGRLLADSTARHPALLHVGFKVLYHGGHIPGSRYVGPASKPEGLAALRQALRKIPRGEGVVLYCGCCPWTDCPNVRPALKTAHAMGLRNVKVLYIARTMQKDWVDQGLPITGPGK